MAEYHVGCGIAGIYAGIMKPNGYEWKTQSDVTDEAISAVVTYLYMKIPDGETKYSLKVNDGITLDINLSWKKGTIHHGNRRTG